MSKEAVNHPDHYQYAGIEVIDLVRQMNFNLGNAVKYIARAGLKDPSKEIEDLQKAIFYIKDEYEHGKDLEHEIFRPCRYGGLPYKLATQIGYARGQALQLICLGNRNALGVAVEYLEAVIETLNTEKQYRDSKEN